jgi:hypothetical protein
MMVMRRMKAMMLARRRMTMVLVRESDKLHFDRRTNEERNNRVEIVIVTIGISTFLLHSLVIVIGKWI